MTHTSYGRKQKFNMNGAVRAHTQLCSGINGLKIVTTLCPQFSANAVYVRMTKVF